MEFTDILDLKFVDELDNNYFLNKGFKIYKDFRLITIYSKKDVFETYNNSNLKLNKKEKILLEACMVHGVNNKALSFFLGYFDPKKDTINWGWKTLKKAQELNQRYLADQLYAEHLKSKEIQNENETRN